MLFFSKQYESVTLHDFKNKYYYTEKLNKTYKAM